MYTAFYGLREKPFALSPDPRFLYLAGSHREALAHLLYGIEQGEGFISVTGEVGTGKTTLCRTLLERLDGDTQLAFLFNPSRTALELLQSICAEFGLPAEGLARRSLMHQLNTFLVEQKRLGKRVLLIIDEAQTLSENTLEQVRLLSNLETSRDKLIQILLLGQPELDRKLDERGLRQLRQRISVRWKLDPLSPHETRAYVRHRLAVAAGEPKDLFTESALKEVHRRTGGIPRLVNQLCDRALLAGYAAREARIGPRLVREAAREIPDARLPRESSAQGERRPSVFRPWMFLGAGLSVVLLSLFAGLQVGRGRFSDTMLASVFKPEALRADFEGQDGPVGPPAVGANAPDGRPAGASNAFAAPSPVELIGFVPEEVRSELNLNGEGALATAIEESGASGDAARAEARALADALAGRISIEAASLDAPKASALAPGLLPDLLVTRDPQVALAESRIALLEGFGRDVPDPATAPRTHDELARAIEARGLTATRFEGGSIELLRRLDHPVALPLARLPKRAPGGAPSAPESEHRWIAVIGFEGDRATVAGLVSDRIVSLSARELEAHWLETGILVWERFESVPPVLTRDADGTDVLWLQRALAELQFLKGTPTRRFDEATTSAVRRFQADRGLVADGVAGPLTQIALYAQLDRYPVPRLSTATSTAATSIRTTAPPTPAATAAPAFSAPTLPPPPNPTAATPAAVPPVASDRPPQSQQREGGDRG